MFSANGIDLIRIYDGAEFGQSETKAFTPEGNTPTKQVIFF